MVSNKSKVMFIEILISDSLKKMRLCTNFLSIFLNMFWIRIYSLMADGTVRNKTTFLSTFDDIKFTCLIINYVHYKKVNFSCVLKKASSLLYRYLCHRYVLFTSSIGPGAIISWFCTHLNLCVSNYFFQASKLKGSTEYNN